MTLQLPTYDAKVGVRRWVQSIFIEQKQRQMCRILKRKQEFWGTIWVERFYSIFKIRTNFIYAHFGIGESM